MPEGDKPADDTRAPDSDFAALWSSDGVTRSMSPTATGMPADLPYLFAPGQRFRTYSIVRPLGKGGMGQVYEAEETDSGRRVALKLLSRGLGDDEERERFLREGQLAASLSHPHCVYVYGTSEIQGFPVIAMELVPEGTLKDRVVADTPLSGAAAVDAVLQVIKGLEAAGAIGILHRDIKPSNCFVHRDGRVLVGDFGLSVAPARDSKGERAGTILGTPGFASPEQLRGDPLDVRSDIYSVGATLFYLLAGHAPFDARDTTSLLAKVANEPPPSLIALRPELPRGLAAIVARCLAKTPAERFASYAELYDALEPFGPAQLAPAPIFRRGLAGIIDGWIAGVILVPLNVMLGLWALLPSHRWDASIAAAAGVVVAVLYYGLLEGLWGSTAGKALFGLRVVDAHQVAPGFPRAALRALIFEGPSQALKQLVTLVMVRFVPDISVGFLSTTMGLLCLGVLFSTARPRNGYLALHDKLSRTRVVRRRLKAAARERTVRMAPESTEAWDTGDRVGPYLVRPGTSLTVAEPTRVEAFDDRLKRRVWIELLPAGAAAVPAWRRDLGRSTRLRWLGGRRDAAERWDAYEAVDGEGLATVAATRQPWSRVRHWLSDLAQELTAGLDDGSLPPLVPERVWLGRDGHIRLLDWRVDGERREDEPRPDLASAQRFIYGVCVSALTAVPFDRAMAATPDTPMPMDARVLLLSLRDAKFASSRALLDAIGAVAATPASLPRSRRALQVALCAALPIAATVITIGTLVLMQASKGGLDTTLFTLDACLNELEATERKLRKGPDEAVSQRQKDVEVYMAEHLAATIDDPATWTNKVPNVGNKGGRERARRAIAAHPVRTPEEVRRADATVADLMDDQAKGMEKLTSMGPLGFLAIAVVGGTLIFVAFMAGIGALVTGSGFSFRMFGAALVNWRGQRISRIRALWRAAVTWMPVAGMAVAFKVGPDVMEMSPAWVLLHLALLLLFAGGAAWAIGHPMRGIQDRLAGTWIVPR